MKENPIPNQLNWILSISYFVCNIGLLIFASRLSLLETIPVGILFSFLLLGSYALMHEATHMNLHSNPNLNRVFGILNAILFPTSFTMVKITHIKHHCCNRTEHEMFDLYEENKLKYFQILRWYLVLLGGFWFMVPIGPILLSIYPNFTKLSIVQNIKSSQVMFEDMKDEDILSIRLETLLMMLLWLVLFFIVGIQWQQTLILYLCFAFNWSTRQYITHAFTKRDVIEGAHNLTTNIVLEKLLLHSNWDYEHHLDPNLPWIYLKESGLKNQKIKPISYLKQYFRLWTGPKLNLEIAPTPLPKTEYVKAYEG
ncbi:fatty acid desaturase [Leptospira sp. GIMC2001]|uniref:fatty acid desaturase n=1 Tax=Leptospira sp. GIMC2001 TaxID=1513297 RepID=UPI00234AC5DA|nr:fatty acid desaturase [Leptospira sp. GIMC2001]WCL49174.1 fatty acid desaturase [Leptospira sp. GIMC2001]